MAINEKSYFTKQSKCEKQSLVNHNSSNHQIEIRREFNKTELYVKRLMDIFGALFGIVLFSPILISVSLIIKIMYDVPVVFFQERSGLGGKSFKMMKFSSMVSNAEELKKELIDKNEVNGPCFKITHDPRITDFGKFIRKYSIDELPQLFNVLKGDMSLVGPRPLPVDEFKSFNEDIQKARMVVKPGITCLWQVQARGNRNCNDWIKYDLEYISKFSVFMDIKILFKTIPAVLSGRGAS